MAERATSDVAAGHAPDEGEAIDGAVLVDGHGVDESGEGEAIAQGEADDTGARQQRLRGHLDLRYLRASIHRID